MVDPSDSSAKRRSSRPHRRPSALKAGLVAVQKKEYREAIALLQGVAQGARDPDSQVKAQVGLVKAYAGLGRTQEAVTLCEQLTAHPNPSVYQWANQMLRQLQGTARDKGTATTSNTALDDDLAAGLTIRRSTSSPKTVQPTGIPTSVPKTVQQTRVPTSVPKTVHAKVASVTTSTPTIPPRYPGSTSSDSFWRQAGRAQQKSSLGNIDQAKLWVLEAVTLVGLVVWLIALVHFLQSIYNGIINRMAFGDFSLRGWVNDTDPRWVVFPLVAIALLSSFWALRFQLRQTKGLKPLTFEELKQYSPEAGQVLQTFARQRRSLTPTLGYLTDSVPVSFTYGGFWSKKAQLVLSRGLLEQLSEEEIAAVVAAELAHLRFRDAAVLSALVTLAQIPFGIYWIVAQWGNRRSNVILKGLAVVISVVSYGIFWSIRLTGLWLSRMRLFYSDRIASEMTSNPNALTRALLKMAIGTAKEVEHQGQTPAFLEQFDLLSPIGVQSALTLGSLYPTYPGAALLEWDRSNPFRRWLAMRDSHPPLGDRLYILARYAQRWGIDAEVEFSPLTRPSRPTPQEWQPMALQALPALGLLIGLMVGQGLWWFGLMADRMGWLSFDWFRSDFIHMVSLCIGFGITTFLRINPFFPEIKRPNDVPLGNLPELLSPPGALPANAKAVRFQGTLLGRRGVANAIGQDLILKTDAGLLRLHFLPAITSKQNPLAGWRQLQDFLHCSVMATGWFRRGVTPWLDLDVLQSQSSKPLRAGHPLWSTVLAGLLILWSCYTIVHGDL
ncbi:MULTISPECIES: zinc metalloprotease HtpX [unclassified Leptolyngbya]|uniref:zinc metalloprotease HtpX n=1 Tax=unclassified Leptolyngbya TaxID=2650499 RepID=UPI001688B621|nr:MULTISPECIES: zinc metalloprotease HtpX [unclassified Leptolyngbya]MBD1909624.1 M48 family metalloprotease [Leptolyngbya sp. FACHB-8]MBD2154162.1 M48 family metalloprotease [Leptolyngbya sp. FACHB-16]